MNNALRLAARHKHPLTLLSTVSSGHMPPSHATGTQIRNLKMYLPLVDSWTVSVGSIGVYGYSVYVYDQATWNQLPLSQDPASLYMDGWMKHGPIVLRRPGCNNSTRFLSVSITAA